MPRSFAQLVMSSQWSRANWRYPCIAPKSPCWGRCCSVMQADPRGWMRRTCRQFGNGAGLDEATAHRIRLIIDPLTARAVNPTSAAHQYAPDSVTNCLEQALGAHEIIQLTMVGNDFLRCNTICLRKLNACIQQCAIALKIKGCDSQFPQPVKLSVNRLKDIL